MATNTASEVEETMTRIRSHKGVEGVVIMTREGAIIQSSLSADQSKQHAALISSLTEKASLLIQTLDPDDDLNFLRIRSKKKEIMVAPDNGFLMMVIQNPNAVE
jgi:dynein light chain roadblock-type